MDRRDFLHAATLALLQEERGFSPQECQARHGKR